MFFSLYAVVAPSSRFLYLVRAKFVRDGTSHDEMNPSSPLGPLLLLVNPNHHHRHQHQPQGTHTHTRIHACGCTRY